jgi:hypothetical protein
VGSHARHQRADNAPARLETPKHDYTVGARVIAGVLVWVGLAAIFRLLVFGVTWLQDRLAVRT